MQRTLIRHKVKDYDKWKSVFDENSANRKAGGEKGGHLFRNKADRNEIFIDSNGTLWKMLKNSMSQKIKKGNEKSWRN